MQSYTYSIQNDFPNHKMDSDRLSQEINHSGISIALNHIDTVGDDCYIWFISELPSNDEMILDNVVSTHTGDPIIERQTVIMTTERTASDGAPLLTARKPDGPKITFITPNWCDKTTWYQGSVLIQNEIASDDGYHFVYSLAHQNLIDTYHGKITFEDDLLDNDGYSFRVTVLSNGVVKAEQDPHYGTGGDYTIDYVNGKITFLQSQGNNEIKVSYHYANLCNFTVFPRVGYKLLINKIEIQLSEDMAMNDSLVFQPYGYVDAFAPQLMNAPYNIPSGTKIPLGNPLIYKTINDLLNDSNRSYPSYPALGSSNWRGLEKPAYIFIWDYEVGATILSSRAGMEIRVKLEHNEKCGGAFATAAFYCTSEVEV